MIVVDQEVAEQDHGLDRVYGGGAEVGAHPQRLVAGRGVELGRLFSVLGICSRDELRSTRQHDEEERYKGSVALPRGLQ